ncbi:MAG TPA: hypothetical protein VMD78_14940 [Candidatus Baltobacteraceae bacterium]|nr:hypothetical protein [Candidatus Baltobacteraceae bacterium]
MKDAEFPQWLDKVETHATGVFTLDDGECVTAEVLKFNDRRSELNVEVISSNRPRSERDQRHRAIPVSRIISFEPQPSNDPCRGGPFSYARFILLATLFLAMTAGGLTLFVLLANTRYGVQEASAIVYTIAVVFFTFAATRQLKPYRFTCPAVRTQIPNLLWRHLGFLMALFFIQTLALAIHPHLSDWWDTPGRKGTPFETILLLLCVVLSAIQIYTNRSVLDRAHREFSRHDAPSGVAPALPRS